MDTPTLHLISFPAQTPPQNGSFLTSPKATQAWIDGLSNHPLGRAAHELYKVLHHCNRISLERGLRLELAQLFIQPVLRNARRLEKYYLNSSFPLKERDRKVAQLSR
ncbi:MAG: hypothetical protein HQL47_08805, partial [Gammaproteobacteria bacterium]|nr:hypothetical protein [Gammaproteobacteria bacterium]